MKAKLTISTHLGKIYKFKAGFWTTPHQSKARKTCCFPTILGTNTKHCSSSRVQQPKLWRHVWQVPAPACTKLCVCLYNSKRKFSTTTKIIFEPVELNVAKMYQSLENISSLYSTIRKDDKKEEEKTNKHERCSIQIWIFEEIWKNENYRTLNWKLTNTH